MEDNFWDKVSTRHGRRYLFIISNDNNDEAPEWFIRWWNITGHNRITSYQSFIEAENNDEFSDWAGAISFLYDYDSDGIAYKSFEEAKDAMKQILKSF